MATLKQRLHRKNSSGTYDTVHLESSSDLILRPSGRTVEQDLADYLPQVQNNDNVPESLNKLIIGITKAFVNKKSISFEGHSHDDRYFTESEMTTKLNGKANSSHNHSASNITSGTLPVTRGGTGVTNIDALKSALGIGGGSGSLVGMSYNLTGIGVGKPVRWANDIWICVHQSGSTYYLAATSIYCITQFGSNANYAGSTLAAMCTHVQNITPQDSLDLAINTSVNGVTAKIFVASYEQLDGEFSYFSDNIQRQCDYTHYWTSSARDSNVGRYVTNGGDFNTNSSAGEFGFRPFVALQL